MNRSLGWRSSAAVGALVGASLAIVPGGDAAGRVVAVTPPVFSGIETRVSSSIGDEYDPAISGDIVVFTSYRSVDTDVYYVDLATGQEHLVTGAPGNQELTDVSDGRIVYSDLETLDLMLFDIATGTPSMLTPASLVAINPVISGDLIAWEDVRDGNQNIGVLDLSTGLVSETPGSSSPAVDAKPAVDGGVITWESCDSVGCDVLAYDWTTGVSTEIEGAADVDARRPDVSGRTIVYDRLAAGERDIVAFDLDTGVTRSLAVPGVQVNASISGDLVAFETVASGVYHVALWSLTDDQVYTVTNGAAGQFLNDIDGDRIVYTDDRDGQLDIYSMQFTLVPPFSIVSVPDAYTVQAGTSLAVAAPGLLGNDTVSDPADIASITLASPPSKGQVTALGRDGSFTYLPNSGVVATTDTFIYRITDTYGRSVDAEVTVTISGTVIDVDHVAITLSGGSTLRLDGDLSKGALRLVTANGRPTAILGAGQMPGTVAGKPATIGLLLGRVGTTFTGVITIADPGTGFARALTFTGTATLTDSTTATGHGTVTDPLTRGRNKFVATIDWTIHDAS